MVNVIFNLPLGLTDISLQVLTPEVAINFVTETTSGILLFQY